MQSRSTFAHLVLFTVGIGLGPALGYAIPAVELVKMKIAKARPPGDYNKYRKILVSPTVNTPELFEGFGGFCGWPKICRLHNGDLFVTFCAGYWHASWPTPLENYEVAEYVESLKKREPMLRNWNAPDGGKMMWIRSRDRGRTWSRPEAFPIIRGAYGIGDVTQLSDGTMIAAALIQNWRVFARAYMPSTPLEFAKAITTRLPMKTVVFRSHDAGESWHELTRISGPFFNMGHPQSLFEAQDGGVMLLTNGVPFPMGTGWHTKNQVFITLLMRSTDKGQTWQPVSVVGSNDFSVEEGSAAYLPDGSIGFGSRPESAWFQSYDDGKTWSQPRFLNAGSGRRFKKGDLVVTPDGVTVVLYCGAQGGSGQVIYSRDSGKTWIKFSADRGFQFDPLAYYPNACVLEDGSIFAVGDHQGFKNKFGPYGGEVTAMRFRIRLPEEGEGIELLPIGGSPFYPTGIDTDAANEADRALETGQQ